MTRYIVKRLLWLIPVVLLVAVTIFTIMYLVPGDATTTLLGTGASYEAKMALREEMGWNDPYIVQLLRFLKEMFVDFNMGTSYAYGSSVAGDLMARLPLTVVLAFWCCLITAVVGIPLGVAAAVHQNGFIDKGCTLIATLGSSLPNFWFALMLVILFAVKLEWLPAFGYTSWKCWILPITANSIMELGGIARQMRSQMLEVIRADYAVTARAKGLSETTIRYRHLLPNALMPVVTTLGTRFGRALGGTVIIESVFSIPGVGMYLVEAISARDYPVIRGGVVVLAILLTLIVLITDLVLAYIDPRIKAQYENQGKSTKRMKKYA